MNAVMERESVESPALSLDQLDPDAEYTIIRKNWGTSGCPAGKVDYLTPLEFRGGVCRGAPGTVAQALLKTRLKHHLYVLSEDATEAEFIKATGIQPMPVAEFAHMFSGYNLTEIKDVLGEERFLELATQMKALVAGVTSNTKRARR